MMIDETQAAAESIIINYFNNSDAVIIIDNQLNNNHDSSNYHTLSIPTINAKLFDLSSLFASQILPPLDTDEEVTIHNSSSHNHSAKENSEGEITYKSIDSSSGVTGDDACSSTGSIEDEPKTRKFNGSSSISDDVSVTRDDGLMDTSLEDHTGGDDDDDSEPELTNLAWLTEPKNFTNLSPQDLPIMNDQPVLRFNKFINAAKKSREEYDKKRDFYESNTREKPPFNYAHMIAMALLDHGRLTLQEICRWIQDRFAFYKVHDNWNNSIRHNLSLNFFFTKRARNKNEKGKGGYWELSMDRSKSDRKRRRRKLRISAQTDTMDTIDTITSYPTTRSRTRTETNKSQKSKLVKIEEDMEDEDDVPHSLNGHESPEVLNDDIGRGYSAEEVLNSIDENIDAVNSIITSVSTNSSGDGTGTSLPEIYFADQIPQCTNTDIIVPFLSNTPSGVQLSTIPASQNGPNVIVEPVPCYLPTMDTFDENELNGLIDLNEQELIDHLLDGGTVEFM